MKTSLKLLFCAVVLLLGSWSSLYAQEERQASMDPDSKVIQIDAEAPFGYLYYLDISGQDFDSAEAAKQYFRKLNTALVSYSVNFAEDQVKVLLSLRSQPEWSAEEWNAYLAKHSGKP